MPPRKSDRVKKLSGTYRPDRAAPAPLAVPLDPQPPEPPATLPDHLMGTWAALAGPLHAAGILATVDAPLLEMAVLSLEAARGAADELRDRGAVLDDPMHGAEATRRNPAAVVLKDATASYLAAVRELGLTPAARAKLAAAMPEPATRARTAWEGLDR